MEKQDISFSFSSTISHFPYFCRISPCITQLEEQWRDLDLTSWQIQGCQTTTPALWFNKPCHLHSPVRSLHKHLPQIDRLGESFHFLISPVLWLQQLHAGPDGVLVVLKVQLHAGPDVVLVVLEVREFALDPANVWQGPPQYVLQTVGKWPGYCIHSRPGTVVQKGQNAVLAGESCFLRPVFFVCLFVFICLHSKFILFL